MLNIANILSYISAFSVLIPLSLFLKNIKSFNVYIGFLFGGVICVSALSDIISYIFISLGKSSTITINTFFSIQFFLFSFIYISFLKKKLLIYCSLFFYITFLIVNSLFIQPFYQFQSWSRLVESFFLISYTLIYYLKILKATPPVNSLRTFPTIFNTAVFFYFSLNLFLFIISNYIFTQMSHEDKIIAWSFHNINNFIKNILFAVGIYYAGKGAKIQAKSKGGKIANIKYAFW